jgi:hypothetical protein
MEPYTFTTTGVSTSQGIIDYYSNLPDFKLSSGSTLTYGANIPNFSSITQSNQIMQNKVAVFQVVRDEDDKIIKTEFIKELWVETKNGVSVEFQVARDKDLAEYDASELVIKVISTVSF